MAAIFWFNKVEEFEDPFETMSPSNLGNRRFKNNIFPVAIHFPFLATGGKRILKQWKAVYRPCYNPTKLIKLLKLSDSVLLRLFHLVKAPGKNILPGVMNSF